ncbi:hypothetical protein NGA_0282620, partial [Nannochloropsis gaditana CCMP526]
MRMAVRVRSGPASRVERGGQSDTGLTTRK